jgi:hypothetical protein
MRDRLELPRAYKVGMVFAFNTDLFGPEWRSGETGAHCGDYGRLERATCAAFHCRHHLQRVGRELVVPRED